MQKMTAIHEGFIIIVLMYAMMYVSISHQKILIKLFCLSLAFSTIVLYHLMIRDKLSPAFIVFKLQNISAEILLLIFSSISILFFILIRKSYE